MFYFNKIKSLFKGITVHTTHLRKVGGSMMIAVPPVLLNVLGLEIGGQVGLTLKDGQLIIKPKKIKPKYRLDDLLAQCDANAPLSEEEKQWLDSVPVGRELI